MKEVIKDYIKARTEHRRMLTESRRPCDHDWEERRHQYVHNKMNPDYSWDEWTYVCSKCKECKLVKSQ